MYLHKVGRWLATDSFPTRMSWCACPAPIANVPDAGGSLGLLKSLVPTFRSINCGPVSSPTAERRIPVIRSSRVSGAVSPILIRAATRPASDGNETGEGREALAEAHDVAHALHRPPAYLAIGRALFFGPRERANLRPLNYPRFESDPLLAGQGLRAVNPGSVARS
jgi:hypothetical protein